MVHTESYYHYTSSHSLPGWSGSINNVTQVDNKTQNLFQTKAQQL